MIKRPLVCMLLAFMAGSMLAKLNIYFVYLLISILFLILIFIFFVFKISNQYMNHLDRFLIATPILMYLGFILISKQLEPIPMDSAFDRKVDGKVWGSVCQIVTKENTTAIYIKNNKIILSEGGEIYESKKILLYIKEWENIKIGNKILVDGTISKFSKAANLGQFDEWMYNKRMGIDYKVYVKEYKITEVSYDFVRQILLELRNNITGVYQSLLNEKEAGIISAMLLGEKSLLEEDTKELFQQNGISHILAISGLHVSFIGMMFFGILRKLRMNQLWSACMTTVFLCCYGVLTDFSVSTNRAVVMMIVSMFAKVIGKTYDILSAMALSALIILLQSPLELYNAGFLLSFGAVLGIVISANIYKEIEEQVLNPMAKAGSNCNYLKAVIQSLNVSFMVNLITLPVILYFFYEFPIYSVFLNLLIIPLSSLLILLPILAAIAGSFYIVAGRFFIGGAHIILNIYDVLCKIFGSLPGSVQIVGRPNWIQIILYYGVFIGGLFLIKKYNIQKKIFFIFVFLLVIFLKPVQNKLEITFIDVGQGDGIFIQTPAKTTYLLDGGSSDVSKVGKYRIIQFLKAKGVRQLDYVMITHTDGDHISGILELMERCSDRNGIAIKNLVLPKTSYMDDSYQWLVQLAKAKKISVLFIEKGDVIKDGGVRFTCIHPYEELMVESKNAYSTVLSMEYGKFKALFTGDLEKEGEEAVLEVKDLLDYDLLKVAHHGSKYSTTEEFLKRTKPEIAIISCGYKNRYGHPHKELLERLKRAGCKIYKTMESGAITIKTDGKCLDIREFIK